MAGFFDMKMVGGAKMHDLLQQLPVEIETKIMRNGLAAGVRVLRDEARAQVADSTATGKLRKSIKTTRDTNRKTGQVIAKVKLKGEHSYLGLWMERGVSPHLITVRDGSGALKIGRNFVSGEVMHPGFAAKPFMTPAVDIKGDAAINEVGDYIARYLNWGTIQAPAVAVDEEEAA
ncbi:HK97 gp10 family phage protein [Novosphingobium sp. JCM 18896]|uniref:HK97 gp10 family phage protein n=1 Tax=Novosphingobium sp. JCM 18896 TaxID=2989731 RepID=UPI002223EC79|nr:HK97 gp10 family phage protein [Novosphingobium sp. JCM 18896]MCW1431401.1 HK97 gp10 family phage protein [Novosphingobium sp. JCM 18896]